MPMLQRFKGAALGLAITLVPIAAVACLHFLLVPYTVATVYRADPEIEARVVSSLRAGVPRFYAIVALVIAAYWLFTAALGRGRFLRIGSANIVLALAVLTFAFTMVVAATVPRPEDLFKWACLLLGLSDEEPPNFEGQINFSFDGKTPCEAFVAGAAPIVLLGVPIILLIASAILRIVMSQRRYGNGEETMPASNP